MRLRKRESAKPYDLWEDGGTTRDSDGKMHPSKRRTMKSKLPHPGQSYNPDPEDHKKLLQKVVEKELEFQKKESAIRKALDIKVSHNELLKHEQTELESGISHLIKSDTGEKTKDGGDDSSTDDAYSEYDEKDFQAIVKDKTVVEKRKSKQQRLKQMKDKLQRKAAKLRKLKNIRLSKFDGIKKMMKELDRKEKEEAKRRAKRHKKPKHERFAQKFEPSDPIYCLSDELPSSLRQVSCPLDAVVREQLENFQSRLLIEPTTYQVKTRKYKRKVFDRKIAAEQED